MAATDDAEAHKLGRWPRSPRDALIAAWLLWIVPVAVVGVMVALNPLKRTVTPLYHAASANWWAGQSLYHGPRGMNYLPHFAVLFSPFHLLPQAVGDVLWRFCAAAMLAGGLWKLVRLRFGSEPERPFLWATILAMPLCMNALRNGQANAVFGGLVLLAIAAIGERRWWIAAGMITLAVAVKPLGIVLMLLAPVIYAPLRWRLLAAVPCLAVFPFLFGSPHYVMAQYHDALTNLQACAVVTQHRFADINGILRTFGTALSPEASKIVRVLAGGVTLVLWWFGAKRVQEPLRCLWLYALTAVYLMLFNPMNEENSYVILAPALGIWGAFFLLGAARSDWSHFGWCIAFMALTMGLLPNLLWSLFRNKFALFWHPVMTIFFVAMLVCFIWRGAAKAAEPRVQPA